MKRILILSAIALFASSCDKSYSPENTSVKTKQRIILKESTTIDLRGYMIIEVNSVEYLMQDHGGIYPLVKPAK